MIRVFFLNLSGEALVSTSGVSIMNRNLSSAVSPVRLARLRTGVFTVEIDEIDLTGERSITPS